MLAGEREVVMVDGRGVFRCFERTCWQSCLAVMFESMVVSELRRWS